MIHRVIGRRIDLALVVVMAVTAALVLPLAEPAWGWIAGVRGKQTAAQARNNGVDLAASTHQWATARAIAILDADRRQPIVSFLAEFDPTAPPANDPATGVPLGHPETYAWRMIRGSSDADGVLYPQIKDHLHNFWTHHGRQWIIGASAASNAEKAFAKAVSYWRADDRGQAMYWLGASLHLVQDACVPQHLFYGIGVYHYDYEHWVLVNQPALEVSSGGIYRTDFRQTQGHGGEEWSSSHPRGWVDECAHRSARELKHASHPFPKKPSPADPQWLTREHVGAMQRISAGYVAFFFDEVKGP